MPIEKLQDDDLVKTELAELTRMQGERAPWESQYRDIDDRVNPTEAGGFRKMSPGGRRGGENFDVTAIESLDRFAAAMAAITVPLQTQYIKLRFADPELNKLPAVRRWCEEAGDRLYAIRYAPHTGFGVQASEDFRQLGTYGTSPLWTGEKRGVGLFYKTLHLSECFIDEDFSGRVDTVRRKFTRTARQCAQLFTLDGCTPKMREAIREGKDHTTFEIMHSVRPSSEIDPEALDYRGMPVASIYIAVDEKIILQRAGFHSMPISVSRHITSPGDKYGRSPAMKVLPSIMGVNQMAQTILKSAHKMVDPALAFYSDDGITSIVTRPGGANPGLVNESGQLMVQALPTGSNLPIGLEMIEMERRVIRTAFLEDYFKILTDPSDRMTATQVLETAAKQGVLVAPYASRYESEKQNPVTQRDLELAMRAGQIKPFPPEVIEAGGYPVIHYENPLSRMARAQEAAGLTRWIEAMAPLAQVDDGAVFDNIDVDAAGPGLADVLGVRPSWVATPDQVAAKRKAREDSKMQQAGVEQLQGAAAAGLDLARANQIAEAA